MSAMFLTNSLKKGASHTLARPFLVAGATSIRPPRFPPRSRVSYLGVRSFIVEPNRQGPQNGANADRERAQQEIPKNHSPEASSESRGISPYLTGLLVVGIGLTAYGLYGLYGVMTMWPPEIRQDLRSGLLAKRKGDLDIASQYLTSAWERAKSMPLDSFGDEPLFKITGIGIALAAIYEQENKPERAYQIYEDALWQLRSARLNLPPSTPDKRPDLGIETFKVLSSAEKMRSVALAYKLGEMAHKLQKAPEEEEKWLVWSVEAILRTVLDAPPVAAAEVVQRVNPGTANQGPNITVLVEQLGLPAWTIEHDLAAPFEALGSFYAKVGKARYALPLYLQAISILIPPPPNVSTLENRCRGAQLMGNIAELILRNHDRGNVNPDDLAQAESWARKGLELTISARKASAIKHDVCEEAFAILLYNLAMVRELYGDVGRARALLAESLEQSKAIDMKEGIKHAQDALHALDTDSSDIQPLVVGAEGVDHVV
ncbi:hypothetical protein M413DRAFT_186178 [Hebeloma cylindrosporum]|uniref:Uncharacterized protein n=1 Tax=Hebeloma cylindrosporum TaxID=76867 RepID=A0A0C3BT63_HEBCY|nr:hypothetical protein M413DRAFT_186178 [Hebeloma cylindrosporum h7]